MSVEILPKVSLYTYYHFAFSRKMYITKKKIRASSKMGKRIDAFLHNMCFNESSKTYE